MNNKLTVTRGEVRGDNGRKRGKVFRNMYKGHMDKTKEEGRIKGGKWGQLGWRGSSGGEMETTVLEKF